MTVALWAVAARAMPPRRGPHVGAGRATVQGSQLGGHMALPAGSRARSGAQRQAGEAITGGWLACAPPRLARDFLAS